jgi:hypothetical protein
VEFDLLVIDEASQIRPEDALGVIARAKQIVVVGDQKQLCHKNICPAVPSLLALRLTDNTARPFAEVDLTTLLSRQANASSCHRVGFSRTSMGLYARLYLHIRAAIPCPGLVLCPRLLGKMSDNAVAWLPDLVSAASRPHFIDESTVNFNKCDEHYGP